MRAAVATLVLTSCQRIEPTLVVNLTDDDLAIHYYAPEWMDDTGHRQGCPLRERRPEWRPGVKLPRTTEGWQPMTSARLDYENCTADLVIPPHATVWILINATCEDDEKIRAVNPRVRPTIQSFSATQNGRRMSLEGWDVVRAFKRRSGLCTLKVTANDLG